jgi:hypothetical protein
MNLGKHHKPTHSGKTTRTELQCHRPNSFQESPMLGDIQGVGDRRVEALRWIVSQSDGARKNHENYQYFSEIHGRTLGGLLPNGRGLAADHYWLMLHCRYLGTLNHRCYRLN